jgi:flagellar biosynthesis protein FlhG
MARPNLMDPLASRSRGDSTHIISILSGKGGVGKSVLAFNLAERMADRGYRVLLVDADISSGNLHVLANAASDAGLQEPVTKRRTLSEAVISVSDRFDLLISSSSVAIEDFGRITPGVDFIRSLRAQSGAYDFVLIDHMSGVSRFATTIAHGSDLLLIVLVPELTSIADAYGLLKYLVQSETSVSIRLLINRVIDDAEAGYISARFESVAQQFLSRSPATVGHVIEDDAVRRAIAAQQPVAVVDSGCAAVQNLNSLIDRLASYRDALTDPITIPKINETTAAADIKG